MYPSIEHINNTLPLFVLGNFIFWLLLNLFLKKVVRIQSGKTVNAICELIFYIITVILSISVIIYEHVYHAQLIGTIGLMPFTNYVFIYLACFFIYEAIIKYNKQFTLIHHLVLAFAIILLLSFGYYIAVIPWLLLYELPGIFDVINMNFVSSRGGLKRLIYLVAITTRLATTIIVGPLVLYLMLVHISMPTIWSEVVNIIIAITSITLNLLYSVKSIKTQLRKLKSLNGV